MAEKYLDALANANHRISDLKRALLALSLVAVVGMYLIKLPPTHLRLNVSPSLRPGDVVDIRQGRDPVPVPNVYAFSYYVWQQVNRWSVNGLKDYPQQIFNLQHYLTPACLAQLNADARERSAAGELSSRTRSLNEAPGQRFADWRVTTQSDDAWYVLLDLELTETLASAPVKNAFIRYPLRVVRYDIDPEKNPFGLALDCFGAKRPQRLQPEELGSRPGASAAKGAATKAKTGAAPAGGARTAPARGPGAGDAPAPATLPRTSPY